MHVKNKTKQAVIKFESKKLGKESQLAPSLGLPLRTKILWRGLSTSTAGWWLKSPMWDRQLRLQRLNSKVTSGTVAITITIIINSLIEGQSSRRRRGFRSREEETGGPEAPRTQAQTSSHPSAGHSVMWLRLVRHRLGLLSHVRAHKRHQKDSWRKNVNQTRTTSRIRQPSYTQSLQL